MCYPVCSVVMVLVLLGGVCGSVVEHPLLVQWVVGSIIPGGPIELFPVSTSVPQLVNKGHGMCYPVCSVVKHPLLVQWVVGSIIPGGPIELFLVPTSALQLVNKDYGMCYLVCGMMHKKDQLLQIGKSSVAEGSFFSHYLWY